MRSEDESSTLEYRTRGLDILRVSEVGSLNHVTHARP